MADMTVDDAIDVVLQRIRAEQPHLSQTTGKPAARAARKSAAAVKAAVSEVSAQVAKGPTPLAQSMHAAFDAARTSPAVKTVAKALKSSRGTPLAIAAGLVVAAAAASTGSASAAQSKTSTKGLTKRELEAAKADSAARTAESAAKAEAAKAEAAKAESAARVEAMRVQNERAALEQQQETERARIAAETSAAKLKAEREQRAANLNLAGTVGGAAVGVVAGKVVASKLKKADAAAEELRATQSKNLATVAKGGAGSVRAKAVAKTAQDMKLVSAPSRTGRAMRAAGKMGLPYVAGLATEAVVSRIVAQRMAEDGNVEAAAAANALSMVGTAGAITLAGQRATDMVSPTVLPDARDIAKIEESRIKAGMDKPPPRPKGAPSAVSSTDKAVKTATTSAKKMGKAMKAAASTKVLLPAVAVVAAASAAAGGASAAEAAKAGADVLTSGALSSYDQQKESGASTLKAATVAAAKSAAAFATLGLSTLVTDQEGFDATLEPAKVANAGGRFGPGFKAPGTGIDPRTAAVLAQAKATPVPADIVAKRSIPAEGNSGANRLNYEGFRAADAAYAASRPAAAPARGAESDGRTDDYVRLDPRTGQMVHVTGFATPTRR